MRQRLGRWVATFALAALVGCGGGGTTVSDPPPDETGRVAGNLGSEAAGATVRLDGTGFATVCAPDGSFRFDDVPAGEYTVSVETSGGQGGSASVRVSPGGTVTVPPILLDVAGQLTGLVSNLATGQPLAGARVLARRTPVADNFASGVAPEVVDGLGLPSRQQADEPYQAEPPRVTTTAADGSYRFGGVAPGPYSVEVSLDGYESGSSGAWVEPGRTGVADVFMRAIDPANATVSGAVTTTGGPSPGALAQVRVELWPQYDAGVPRPLAEGLPGIGTLDGDIDPAYLPPFFEIRSDFTDEQGRYTIRNVPPGAYRLTFRRYGYTDIERNVILNTAEQRTENAALAYRLTTIAGQVVRVASNGVVPVAEAEVWAATWFDVLPARQDDAVTQPAIYPWPVGRGSAVTGADGRFTIEVEAGEAYLSAFHPEYGSAYRELTVPLSGSSGVVLQLEAFDVPPGGGVDGGGSGGSGGGTTVEGSPGVAG